MRYRHPLIIYIHGPADSGKVALAAARFEALRGDLHKVDRIDNFAGGDDLQLRRWTLPDYVIVTSTEAPSKKLRLQLYEVIECSARRRPAWLKKKIAARIAERDAKCEPWFDGSAFKRALLRSVA